jgi:Ni,Fe-hydrogenase III large subunit
VDALSGWFLLLLSVAALPVILAGLAYTRAYDHHGGPRLAATTNLFLASMVVVLLADGAYGFVLAWELMAIASYLLVVHEHAAADVRRAGFVYLAMTQASRDLEHLHAETRTFTHHLVEHDGFMDRVRGTGRLDSESVRALGGVGVAARASGVDTDLRRERPYASYGELVELLRVPVHTSGDVEARLRQRLAESTVSFRLLEALLATSPPGPVRAEIGWPEAGRLGLGAIESPRGADVHAVLCDADGRIARYRVRSASFPNWPLVALAAPGNLLPDFPLINKSFELCYACLDR